jgi:hypothetical protein
VCEKRHRFDYRDEAEAMANRLARKLPPRMKVYQCPECHLWCLTSGPLHRSDLLPEQVFSDIIETMTPLNVLKQ